MSCNRSRAATMTMSLPLSRPATRSPSDEWLLRSACSDDSRAFSAVSCSAISCCCCCSGCSALCSSPVLNISGGDDEVTSQSSATWCSPAAPNTPDYQSSEYVKWKLREYSLKQTHTHTCLTALFPGIPRWAGTRKVKRIWILLKQETVSGSGISWAICKSAPRSRQITTPAPHCSVFYRPGALPAAQPTASKHWRHIPWSKTE